MNSVLPSEKAYLLLLNGLHSPDRLSESSLLRVEKLLSIWDGKSWIILSTGFTRHKPAFLDKYGCPVMESRVAAHDLVSHGVERSRILIEELSSDTIGNIYYTMLLLIQPLRIKHICVVSSAFHLARVRAVFEWISCLSGWDIVPAVEYAAAPNPTLSDDLWHLLRDKESAGIDNIARLRGTVTRAADMCLWLQNVHKNYSFDAEPGRLPENLLQLY